MGSLPVTSNSFNDLLVRIKATNTNPNVGKVTQVVLKEGPRAFRVATLFELIDPATRAFHHYQLRIEQIDRKGQLWFSEAKKIISLSGEDPNEIERLHRFLEAAQQGKYQTEAGDLRLIRGEDYARLEQLLQALPNLAEPDKFQVVKTVLTQIDSAASNTKEFAAAFQGTSDEVLGHISAASRLVHYRKVLEQLKALVADPTTPESAFQKHLDQNPWLFGSEYSALLPRRTWTRDDRFDYMLRRTADDYVEIVEIKTAFTESLFVHDKGRDVYSPSARLSPVIGQVMRYIAEVEKHRNSILVSDEVDTLKIRARVIVGRSGSRNEQEALRNLNGHLHRIEIITFDQLIKIGERVISIFDPPEAPPEEYDDDIPF